MFSVQLICPGTRQNKAIIKRDLDINVGGLNFLRNTGACSLFVGALDSSGKVVDDMQLAPGDSQFHYQPSPGAVLVYAVGTTEDSGTAILVYDDPDLVA